MSKFVSYSRKTVGTFFPNTVYIKINFLVTMSALDLLFSDESSFFKIKAVILFLTHG